jgi:S-DNA-T family DNA segregation ATPase FtsK/SpoIIIE
MRKRQHISEIKGIVIFGLALLVLASLLTYTPEDIAYLTSSPNVPVKNAVNIFGAYIAFALNFCIGRASYTIALLLLFWSWNKFLHRETGFKLSKALSVVVLIAVISAFFGMMGASESDLRFQHAGILGAFFSSFLIKYLGRVGAYIVLVTLGLLSFVLISEFLISPFIFGFTEKIVVFANFIKDNFVRFAKNLKKQRARRKISVLQAHSRLLQGRAKQRQTKEEPKEEIPRPKIELKAIKPKIKESPGKQTKPDKKERTAVTGPKTTGDYKLPSLDLLDEPAPVSSRQIKDDLLTNAKILEETLSDFGVAVRVADIERGPVITRYELEPAPGVKVQKISALSDDIALAMKAQSIRIVAPIPGKGRVGIEVPNTQSNLVYLKDILSHEEFKKSKSKLTLALGKDIGGEAVIADLAEMPHLLIAGTTGSGKTVCVNSIVMSMLFSSTPDEIKFLMVDPKMVELAAFNGLPHLLCPVITDAKKVSNALNWVVNEMESRYELLAKAGVRNIDIYNLKHDRIPYIVVIIDELADLMAIAAAQIENAITRLAQLSRAVGIHLILATQRPSVDVITGVIKANFPARISFKVASKVDSRTVLDMNGADKLLGRGDMLFLNPGDAKPIRAQGSLVQDREIDRVVEFIRSQRQPEYDEEILKENSKNTNYSGSQKDALFDDAVRLILESNHASVSILQRRMRLGYTRAARLIDAMEQEGIIGPFRGSRPREILVDREAWLEAGKNE